MTKADFKTKKIEDLAKGEVWSINPKARKLVLANIDPTANVIESTNVEDGRKIVFSYSDHQGSTVFCHGEEVHPEHDWNPELWQRVCLNGGEENRRGTIVDVNDSKPPDLDIIILWDTPVNKRWMTEQHTTDISLLEEKCAEDLIQRAKEARALVKDLQNEHEKGYKDDAREVVQEEMAKTMARKEEYKRSSEQITNKAVQALAKTVMDSHSGIFKAMIEAGMLSLTAGEEEGEIDRIPEMVDSHLDSIKMKVDAATHNEDLKIPVIVAITQLMANTMFNQYFLTRKAFIRVRGNKWALFSDKNEKLGIHANKKGAVKQLRLIEYKNRHGLEN